MESLRSALDRTLDRLLTGHVDYLSSQIPGRRLPPPRGQPIGPPHAHGFVEAVLCLRGCARLNLARGALVLRPDRLRILLPGTIHCEQMARRNRPYTLLWLVVAPATLSVFTSLYAPGAGYASGSRFPASPRRPERLCSAAACPDIAHDVAARARFTAALLDAIADAFEQMDKSPRLTEPTHALADRLRAYLDSRLTERVTLAELGQLVRRSPNHVNALFRRHVGTPVRQYLIDRRLDRARELLRDGDAQIKTIAYSCGFRDPLYFSRLFRRRFAVSPRRARVAPR